MPGQTWTLDDQRRAFIRKRFLAMPIAGTIAWSAIGVVGWLAPLVVAVWSVFIGTGLIFYLGLLVARITGEDLLGREGPKNFFDGLFLSTVAMAVLVYSIAIPFFLIDPTSLPLTVGILTGLMWVPFSTMIGHWAGYFHTIVRTASVVAVWYLVPGHRFTAVPVAIVVVYLVTIWALTRRHRELEPV